jgi:hypothetical protein
MGVRSSANRRLAGGRGATYSAYAICNPSPESFHAIPVSVKVTSFTKPRSAMASKRSCSGVPSSVEYPPRALTSAALSSGLAAATGMPRS